MNCYDCRYWARYPMQKKPDVIIGYCTYWEGKRDATDTCSGWLGIEVIK